MQAWTMTVAKTMKRSGEKSWYCLHNRALVSGRGVREENSEETRFMDSTTLHAALESYYSIFSCRHQEAQLNITVCPLFLLLIIYNYYISVVLTMLDFSSPILLFSFLFVLKYSFLLLVSLL